MPPGRSISELVGSHGRSYLAHLRLPFNLLLAPIYLWGVVLAGGTLQSWSFWLGFASLHVFLYGGTTAFNSYYDRDQGPIGGMVSPPRVGAGLLPFSLSVQALGVPFAAAVGTTFLVVWLLLFSLAFAYSHPRFRLKARAYPALLAVAFGQGGLGFAAGWFVVDPRPASLLGVTPLVGIGATALLLAGLYIVTQSYQTQEDRRRGDLTLPVILGARRALMVALALLALGAVPLLLLLAVNSDWPTSILLALLLLVVGIRLAHWANSFRENEVIANYQTAMRLVTVSSLALTAALIVKLWPA